MSRVLFALVFAPALGLAACGYTETHTALLRAPQSRRGHAVELYMAAQPPARPFYEIALVQVIGHGDDAELEPLMKALTKRGDDLGCDAVVRVQIDVGYTRAHAVGVCVGWLGPAPSGASVPAAPPAAAHPPRPPVAPAPSPRPESLPSSSDPGGA